MGNKKEIKTALISVYHKDKLDEIISHLHLLGVRIFSTGGTANFVESQGIPVSRDEDLTGYPSILGGRVKTLHPMVFGGILARREVSEDQDTMVSYGIPEIDLVIVDLYPFEETLAAGGSESEVIEKIDIGGISLIRAAAKNHRDVLIVPSKDSYGELLRILTEQKGISSLDERKEMAGEAFAVSSHYDTAIWQYFNGEKKSALKLSLDNYKTLRYGENPHQEGRYYGNLSDLFEQLNGKEISYNNLLDIDAAVRLIDEFSQTTFAVLKHNNACGLASRAKMSDAWKDALAGDPVSAFGGILVTNRVLDLETATEIDKIFYEVIIAPDYEKEALEVLNKKKNRIILKRRPSKLPDVQFRTILDGVLWQNRDMKTEGRDDFNPVTKKSPSSDEIADLLFANILVKHTKSNAIVLVKNEQLLASGVGQTSRIDALEQAIEKAGKFGFELNGAVMSSDAFFPFKDSVEIAHKAGIKSVIQPGGSIRDKESIDFCYENNMSMVVTGTRHFKH